MLRRIASARTGETTTSITTDVRFLVVLAFIFGCLLDQLMRCSLLRDEHDFYNPCASGPVSERVRFCGITTRRLSPVVDKARWSNREDRGLFGCQIHVVVGDLGVVARS
jgi:hypothetical protein